MSQQRKSYGSVAIQAGTATQPLFQRFREKSAGEIDLDDLGADVFAVKYRFRSVHAVAAFDLNEPY